MIHVNVRGIIVREHNNQKEIVVQLRKREGNPECFELPGGRIEEYESITEALKREVLEETGLNVTSIKNEHEQVFTKSEASLFKMQCIKPYAAYQTLSGPVDSFGIYFLCEAEGEFLKKGDDTENAHWASIAEIQAYVKDNKFSDIDKPAIIMYLNEFVMPLQYLDVIETMA